MDWRFGMLASTMVNLQLPKNRKPFTPEDFMPVYRDVDRKAGAARSAERRRLNDAAAADDGVGVPEAEALTAAPAPPAEPDEEHRALVAARLEDIMRGMMVRRKR